MTHTHTPSAIRSVRYSSPYKAERGRRGGREGEGGPLWPGYEGTGGVLRVVVFDPQTGAAPTGAGAVSLRRPY